MNIIRAKQITEKVGLSLRHIYRLVDEDKFPKPLKLGPNSVGWLGDEVDGWIQARVAERDHTTEAA